MLSKLTFKPQACLHVPMVRDFLKLYHIPPAALASEDDESAIFYTALAVITARHCKHLMGKWLKEVRAPRGSSL